jgi:hypothetical protein
MCVCVCVCVCVSESVCVCDSLYVYIAKLSIFIYKFCLFSCGLKDFLVLHSHVSFVFNAKFPISFSAQIFYPERIYIYIYIHIENVVNILTH